MLRIAAAHLAPDYLPYSQGWQMQQDLHAKVAEDSAQAAVILCEHEPVYTAGARTRSNEMPDADTEVVRVGRGGKITWHGPGQLVGYPIVHLGDSPDVVRYVRQLEEGLINALQQLGIVGFRVEGRSGVWVKNRHDRDEKIAAIGVRVQKNVTLHGFALNCNNDLAPFRRIIPCGISDAGVTTISRVLQADTSPAQVLELVNSKISAALEYLAPATGPACPTQT